MRHLLHDTLARARAAHAAAAPASTLLWASVIALGVAFAMGAAQGARAAAPTHDAVSLSWLPERAAPGETIEVAMSAPADHALVAWLPGLDVERISLRYDAETGLHLAALRLPLSAPTRGYCTVRVQDHAAREWSYRLALAPPDPS